MKLLFSKTNHEGRWFAEAEDITGYTEKIPPNTAHVWDENAEGWVLPEPVYDESEPDEPMGEKTE